MHIYDNSDPVIWERILQKCGLGLNRGMRLGNSKLIYCGVVREDRRPFAYSLREKQVVANPYYRPKGRPANQFFIGRVDAEHTRMRKRMNKRAQRARERTA
jgi:hypothetical protein